MAYIYCADKYCDACGKDIIKRLKKEGKKKDKYGDSNDWPQSCLDDEESDGPDHCGSGPDCLDPWEDKDGNKYGHFFENNLTDYGVQNIKEMHLNSTSEVTQMWVDYYEGCGVDFGFNQSEYLFTHEECIKEKIHLLECDDDGYCNNCGEQE